MLKTFLKGRWQNKETDWTNVYKLNFKKPNGHQTSKKKKVIDLFLFWIKNNFLFKCKNNIRKMERKQNKIKIKMQSNGK